MLSFKEAVAILETCSAKGVPIPFAISFCTADESRGTGGEIVHYEQAIWHVTGNRVRADESAKATAAPRPGRSANQRWIRRIRAIDSDQIRQVHVHLILTINGMPVR